MRYNRGFYHHGGFNNRGYHRRRPYDPPFGFIVGPRGVRPGFVFPTPFVPFIFPF